MAARIQGFPDEWQFSGGKTAAYRQIGNAFPPPVAEVVAKKIMNSIQLKKMPSVLKNPAEAFSRSCPTGIS
jgi:DNA (cytosine-5)-methyltransferase 1